MSPIAQQYVAIDPIATILHGRLLDIYYLIHHPHVPSIKTIEEVMKRATPEERRDVIARANLMIEFANAVKEVSPRDTAVGH